MQPKNLYFQTASTPRGCGNCLRPCSFFRWGRDSRLRCTWSMWNKTERCLEIWTTVYSNSDPVDWCSMQQDSGKNVFPDSANSTWLRRLPPALLFLSLLIQVINVKWDWPTPRNVDNCRQFNKTREQSSKNWTLRHWNVSRTSVAEWQTDVCSVQGTRQAPRRGRGWEGFCPHFSRDSIDTKTKYDGQRAGKNFIQSE